FLRTQLLASLIFLQLLAPKIFVQRNPVLIELVPQPVDIFHHVMELLVVMNALRGAALQFVNEQRMAVRPFRESRFRHFVVSEAIFQCAFTKLGQVTQARQNDVRRHAVKLSGTTSNTVKFLNRQFKRAIILGTAAKKRSEPANLENGLHGSFAERILVPHDYGATVILESGCKDFAG